MAGRDGPEDEVRRRAVSVSCACALLLGAMAALGQGTPVEPPPARAEAALTFGKTSVGASADSFAADRKRVNSYALPASGSVPRLSVYLAPTGTTGQQPLRGVIYSDASGRPEGLLGVSAELTFTSTSAAGWYELAFPAPVRLAAGTYWIGIISGAPSNVAGFRYDTVVAARDINTNAYSSGPTDPFGLAYMDSKQMSLYASYEKGPPPDPVLAAVGDIACAAGQSAKPCRQLASADLASGRHPAAVAVLGDTQYESAALSEYYGPGAYNETWGRFNPIVRPSPGNHEYAASSSASGYFTYFGSAAHGGYYSWDLGAWHLIALDSDCSDSGCGDSLAGTTSSAQVSWLQADLAANSGRCVLAYWHHPRFSSGWVGDSPGVAPFWNALYAAHADVVLAGHDHLYERFAQQDPFQHAASDGIREFVVGTGGESLFPMGAIQPNLQAVDNSDFGVLFLTLHADSYGWAFRSIGGTLLDAGSAPCNARGASQPGDGAALSSSEEQLRLAAVRSAATLRAGSAGEATRLRLGVWVQPLGRRGPHRRTLRMRVHCSRACDLRIALRVRRGRRTLTLARYRLTETELPAPWGRIVLRLPRTARGLPAAALKLALVAADASGQTRRLSVSLREVRR